MITNYDKSTSLNQEIDVTNSSFNSDFLKVCIHYDFKKVQGYLENSHVENLINFSLIFRVKINQFMSYF